MVIDSSSGTDLNSTGTILQYFNGTTDYVEIYFHHTYGVSRNVWMNNTLSYFQGYLVRAV